MTTFKHTWRMLLGALDFRTGVFCVDVCLSLIWLYFMNMRKTIFFRNTII